MLIAAVSYVLTNSVSHFMKDVLHFSIHPSLRIYYLPARVNKTLFRKASVVHNHTWERRADERVTKAQILW